MTSKIRIHFDNLFHYEEPGLFIFGTEYSIDVHSKDEFGVVFEAEYTPNQHFTFKFVNKSGDGKIEDDNLFRTIVQSHHDSIHEVWCRSWNAYVYTSQPHTPQLGSVSEMLEKIQFEDNLYSSDIGGHFALGASVLKEGGVLFGLFHPHANKVYVTGDFNKWQSPNQNNENSQAFLEMQLYRGYFDTPNMWYLHVPDAKVGQEYKFYIVLDALFQDGHFDNIMMVDQYSRFLGNDYEANNSIIVNPATYKWHDENYQTPLIHELVIYELHVNGFTYNHPDIQSENQGKYKGIIDRIQSGYFDQLGITCLYLMPIAEVPTPQGETALGYNTSLFLSVERDFGTPDELRELVDIAHQHNIAVIIDQVFNHSANSWNPLWRYIIENPQQAQNQEDGGLYFSGQSPWGNRISTERYETQNMLIDACKLMVIEYHIDGFRFDATHTDYMDHGFLHRLGDEMQSLKPNIILIAENLPNQRELNREGINGFSQWCDFFHDTIKAFLSEGKFEGTDNHPENLGDIFYFSKQKFAAHTNNVINYCESHDEHSVAYEVGFNEALNTPHAKERKGRLGLFATIVALGQPMIYMGQEFATDRERNKVYFHFPEDLAHNGFYQWASRLISLRRRYPGLKLHGFNPIEDGNFKWLIGPWLDEPHGGQKRVIGWVATPSENAHEHLLILMNFENHTVNVDLNIGIAGKWVRLASIDTVNDIAPHGTMTSEDDFTLPTDGFFGNFALPDSSAFIYKWEESL